VKRGRTRRTAGCGATVDLAVDLGPVTLPNPVVAASGTFGHGAEVAELCDPRSLGAVTVKSVAAFPWPGNPPLRVTEARGGGMLNSVGLPGPGVDAWIERDLPALERLGARVIASIWGRSAEEFAAAARPLKAVAHRLLALEVNLSCPNVEARNDVFAHSADSTRRAMSAVVDAIGDTVPAFAKLSPNVTDIVAIADAAIDAGSTGLTLVNSVMGLAIDVDTRAPSLGAGGGGYTGAPIKPVALRAVWEVSRAFPSVPIIGTGGVANGVDAIEMMLAGATAVGVGTATFAEPRATMRIVDEMRSWCVTNRVTDIRTLIGGAR
jgi:dihydroorotate dehydrogenase (NAD+) catalytic subunit